MWPHLFKHLPLIVLKHENLQEKGLIKEPYVLGETFVLDGLKIVTKICVEHVIEAQRVKHLVEL